MNDLAGIADRPRQLPARVPLTTEQQKLYLYHRLYPGDPAFNVVFPYRITGDVDPEQLRTAVQLVVQASVGLNTTFHDGPGGPVGRDERHRRYVVDLVDATEEGAILEHLTRTVDSPMDPAGWPLYEFRVWRGPVATYLTIVLSHLIGDAFALWALLDRITVAYRDPVAFDACASELGDLPADFAEPPDEQATAEAVGFFHTALGGLASLGHDALLAERNDDGALPGTPVALPLGEQTSARVRQLCDEQEISPFAFFLAGYLSLLAALVGRTRVTTGIPLANRRGRRHRRVIGYCINTLPVSFDLAEYRSFAELVRAVEQTTLRLLRHQDFDLTAHATEVFGRTTDRLLAVDNAFTYYRQALGFSIEGAEVVRLDVPRRFLKYPITVNIENNPDGFVLVADYLPRLAAARPLECLRHVLDRAAADIDVALDELTVLDAVRAAELDAMINDHRTFTTLESLPDWFDAVVAEHPDAVAVADGAVTLTYRELADKAGRVAAWLSAHTASGFVGVAMARSADLIAVLLGVLRAGRAYVPLDPGSPIGRALQIVEQFDDLPVIADPGALPDVPLRTRVTPEEVLHSTTAGSAERIGLPVGPDDPAYVIFTSGSSGVPKGVTVTHHNVMRLFAATRERFDLSAVDTWCMFHSYAFDFSVWEVFGALLHGGRLTIVPDVIARSPADFAEHLAEYEVTVLNQTPSAFGQLLKVLTPELADRLAVRLVIFGGEALHFAALAPWFELVGDRARVVNMYGITETTVHVTAHEITAADVGEQASIIGRPLGDLAVTVVDPLLRPVPLGVTGELLVSGAGVARGYRNQPERTTECFLLLREGVRAYRSGDLGHLRADGTLVYQGRRDKQVQLRGYRIELGEVEAALLGVPGVREAAVRLDTREDVEPRLVGYLVESGAMSDVDIRKALRPLLPPHMMPSFLIRLTALPLTVNGKVDDDALPAPTRAEQSPDRPREAGEDPVEAGVRQIWQQAVQAANIGLDDNFFEVGGTSMHVAEVHRALVEAFGICGLTMIDLFRLTTVRQLSAHLRSRSDPAGVPDPTRRSAVRGPRTVVQRHGRAS